MNSHSVFIVDTNSLLHNLLVRSTFYVLNSSIWCGLVVSRGIVSIIATLVRLDPQPILLANSSNFVLGLFSGWTTTLTLLHQGIRSRSCSSNAFAVCGVSEAAAASVMVSVLSDVNLKVPCADYFLARSKRASKSAGWGQTPALLT